MNKIRYLLRYTVQVLGVLFCDWCNLLILFIVRFCHMNKINRLHGVYAVPNERPWGRVGNIRLPIGLFVYF